MIREMLLIYKIWKWHEKTFKDLTITQQQDKFNEEINEYSQAKAKYIKSPYPRRPKYSQAIKDERADVIIAGINLLKYQDAFDEIMIKFNRNRFDRSWKGNHHVEIK